MVDEVIEMNDKNQEKRQEQTPKTVEGVVVKTTGWKKVMAKKWVFPAAYMAAAAIILTLMWVYQGANQKSLNGDDLGLTKVEQGETAGEGAVPVTAIAETVTYPVKDRNVLEVVKKFYDSKASNEDKEAAVVEYNSTFTTHMGVDYAALDDKPFDVLAALSGTVTRVDKHILTGNTVEITAPNGITTIYQSLADVTVLKDQKVKQGDVIAKAGRNELEKEEGTHLHFEMRDENNKPLNPELLLMDAVQDQ
jgi:stage II sporulation protein Q